MRFTVAMLLVASFCCVSLLGGATSPEAIAGTQSTPNVRVSHDTYLAHSEPYVAVNPKQRGNLLGASKLFTDLAKYRFHIGTYVSFDGGSSWHDNGLLPGSQAFLITSDPTVAFNANGVGYVLALGIRALPNHATRSGVYIWRSFDGGRSFGRAITVFEDAGFANDKPWLTVDTSDGPTLGNIYVAWVHLFDRGRHAKIAFSRSVDGATSFSPVQMFNAPKSGFPSGPIVTVAPGGQVHIVYIVLDRSSIDVVGSVDGGAHFGSSHLVSPVKELPEQLPHANFRVFSLPAAAASPTGSALYAAWADYGGHIARVLASRSQDGGQTWTLPVRVDGGQMVRHDDQFEPQLAVGSDGSVFVSYFSRLHNAANGLIDVYLARSADGGVSFSPSQRVTNVSWNPALGAPHATAQETFIGDYQGLAVGPGVIYPFWNDTRSGKQEIYSAAVPYAPVPSLAVTPTPVMHVLATASRAATPTGTTGTAKATIHR
ncbi:MAG: BNR/Asp-box repeat protein [Chloroflexi bacterium]|jgi:hypothetical protein|nr:BNR/Asp-box repeat protein [Chloroflexota bacterium]